LIYQLVKDNNLKFPDIAALKNASAYVGDSIVRKSFDSVDAEGFGHFDDPGQPIILHGKTSHYSDSEDVEEVLSLAEMEKEMIGKALRKYNNRRKDAAEELGISERTLYRKIKEYNIPD